MLHYFRFNADLPQPRAAKPVYIKREKGSGWPEHCPPVRAANAFGFDVINPFDMRFRRDRNGDWELEEAVEVHSDIDLDNGMTPHPQLNAWFWEKGQTRPHVITDNVHAQIRHQVKISTFLYLRSDSGELVWMRGVPNVRRPWSIIESIVETDWYFPAHPWHTVIELPRIENDPATREVFIPAGEPLCRLVTIARAEYEAREMSGPEFGALFTQGQEWLAAHGRDLHEDDLDITGAYAKQQKGAQFVVIEAADDPSSA